METTKFTRAIIITDSNYVYSNHKNAHYWKENKWRTSEGKPYENEDLWDTFLKERQKTKLHTEIVWEKGKLNHTLLRVDALAKNGADHPTLTDNGFKSGKIAGTRTRSKKSALLFPANNQETLIRVYRKNIYGKNESQMYKITFDVYDEVKKAYSAKFVAYQGKDCNTLKRNNCYRALFNKSATFPLIIEAEHIEYLKENS
jgi:hypothetical protein